MYKLKNVHVLLLLLVMVVYSFSCKKSNEAGPAKKVTLTRDSITQNGYTLIFVNKDTLYEINGDSSRKALQKIFFIVYPEITAYWNPDAPKRVTLTIDPTYDGIAYTLNDSITISSVWVLKNQRDVNVVTHEATHVAQQYKSGGYVPAWLVEGLAEYSRNKFGVDNAAVGWYIPDYSQNQNYTDGYTTVARFILWAEAKYKPGIAQALDKELRAGTYSDDASWEEQTGLPFITLWSMYVENPYY